MSDIPVCPVTGRLCRQLCQFSCSWPLDYRNRQAQLGGTLDIERQRQLASSPSPRRTGQ